MIDMARTNSSKRIISELGETLEKDELMAYVTRVASTSFVVFLPSKFVLDNDLHLGDLVKLKVSKGKIAFREE